MKLWLRGYENFKDEADGGAEFWQDMTPDHRLDLSTRASIACGLSRMAFEEATRP